MTLDKTLQRNIFLCPFPPQQYRDIAAHERDAKNISLYRLNQGKMDRLPNLIEKKRKTRSFNQHTLFIPLKNVLASLKTLKRNSYLFCNLRNVNANFTHTPASPTALQPA